jgi:hypothetical protein
MARVRLGDQAVGQPQAATVSLPRGLELSPPENARRVAVISGLGAVIVLSILAWVVVIRDLDPYAITDTGLISILPPTAYAVIAVLGFSFVVALRMRPLSEPLLLAHVVALVFMLYGVTALFEEMPRFITAWLHVSFTDAIARTGELYPLRDARFDWPGFFILFAFVQNLLGMPTLLPILPWVPVLLATLMIGPLYLIYRSATGDLRLVWVALWAFTLMNWIGQDYFSPQGMNMLFMVTIIAILLTWFRRDPVHGSWFAAVMQRVPGFRGGRSLVIDPNASSDGGPRAWLSDRQQIGLVAVVGLLFGFGIASHQLTPFALVGGVTLLVLTGRLPMWGLPLMMGVLLSAWLTFMASTFLEGHLAGLLEDIGRPDQFASSNVAGRLRGSEGHLQVLQARLGFTLLIWIAALIGGLRRLWSGRLDLSLALLAIAPFGLILLQGYGGEMLLRIFLFGLPFMAFFAAAALLPTPKPMSWGLSAVLLVATVVCCVGFVFTRYGNERADLVTAYEHAAVQALADATESGDTVATVNHQVPANYLEWEQKRVVGLPNSFLDANWVQFASELANRTQEGHDAYVILTRGNRAYATMFLGLTEEEWDERVEGLVTALDLEPIYENPDASIYRWTPPADPDG